MRKQVSYTPHTMITEKTSLAGDANHMRRLEPIAKALFRYFDAEILELDRIPQGPALLVGNHNAGVITPDSYVFVWAWMIKNGYTDIPVALGHDLIFRIPAIADLARSIGLVPASLDNDGISMAR